MNEIIKITKQTIGEDEINAVDARELYNFLGSKREFATWIKERINKYSFQEGTDFLTNLSKTPNGRPSKEYTLSLDMAKELSMVENNTRGSEARHYFLECEKIARQPVDPMKALNDPVAMRGLLLTYTEKVLALEEEIKVQAPKVAGFDRIAKADGLTCITDTAKSLQLRPKDLFSHLSSTKWIYRRAGGKGWLAYQNRIQQGVLSHKVTTVTTSDGREKVIESVLVTPKGLSVLAGKLKAA